MGAPRFHILVVDDDQRLRKLLEKYLCDNGYVVTPASNTQQARTKLNQNVFDLIVLDIMMPGETGFEFISWLRKDTQHAANRVPILVLTARGETFDRIEGLERGADDYLAKPFEPKELLLRIQRILQRLEPSLTVQEKVLLGSTSFDLKRLTLSRSGQLIQLTTVEVNLLKILALNPGRAISRDELAHRSGVALSPRTIDVQVTRLRRKIEPNPRAPIYLKTVRHQGYILWPD